MARYRWTGGVALGAVVLGVTTVTGFAPARDVGAAGPPRAAAHERNVRAAVAAGAFSPDGGGRTPGRTSANGRTYESARAGDVGAAQDEDSAEDFGAEYVRGRVARVLPAALAPVCGTAHGREVTFPLFDDLTVQAVEESRSTVGSRLVWHGTVAGTVDQNVVLTLEGGCDKTPGNEILSAQFLLGGDLYAVEPLAPGRVTIAQLSPLTDEDEQPVGAPPNSSGSSVTRVNAPVPKRLPMPIPALVKLPQRPRRSSGAFSMPKREAPPHSPPAAKPWTRRSATSITGAATPTVSYAGRQPIRNVLPPMISSVSTSMALRPIRSPKWPITMPPSGRATNPLPNAAKATRVPTVRSKLGKKTAGKTIAAARP